MARDVSLPVITPALATSGATPLDRARSAAEADAPYLARLLNEGTPPEDPEAGLAAALAQMEAAKALPFPEAMAAMRRAKAAAHLAIALADLAGLWPLQRVTAAVTTLADVALDAALALAARTLVDSGDLRPEALAAPVPGLILLAMGKHGAGELNYSSDIDFSVFFDRERLPVGPNREAPRVAVRLAQLMVKALEETTIEGYVFRTDLRLRPDPASTPAAVSLASAEHYYQTLGQNWERAAFIKARAAAGDVAAGAAFLESLEPFVWRRHLDFAAIADIRSIKRQILTRKGALEEEAGGWNVKLGRGGIRDIELFVQTQQLILGGRAPALRSPRTLEALQALCDAGVVEAVTRATLVAAYEFLRGVEHRIQMLHDEQTHVLPIDADERARVARLSGFAALSDFDAAIAAVRAAVIAADETLFKPEETLADPLGTLSFTGVEDDPGTLATLARLGFAAPQRVTETIRGWHHGRIRATRAARARELLTSLTPRLLRALAAKGAPDLAFERFAAFFARLPAGVQLLALLDSRDALLAHLCDVLTLSPRLAELLGARPATLDAMLDPAFFAPLAEPSADERREAMAGVVAAANSYEGALDAVRRRQREEAFRIDVHALELVASPADVGAAHADLADACVAALADLAQSDAERRFNAAPGSFVVLGLGKFGGRELAHGSDLDLMVVYDAPPGSGAAEFYARVTQRLIAALSAPTSEGLLYDVDMQLRPSGSKGPVAVRLTSFERYYLEEAWTWELLALTRLRVIAGDGALAARVQEIAATSLAKPRDPRRLVRDAREMRLRMERERPGAGLWDLKLPAGGLVDIEFAAQTLMLLAAQEERVDLVRANTGEALAALAAAGRLAPDAAETLSRAWRLYSCLQQLLRIALPAPFAPGEAGAALQARLAEAIGVADFPSLERRLAETKRTVRSSFLQVMQGGSDGL